MSPASGDYLSCLCVHLLVGYGFHSINVPSEWGRIPSVVTHYGDAVGSFHSINVPSEWGQYYTLKDNPSNLSRGFHSINVPSEWGHCRHGAVEWISCIVSIQLMSPASGDSNKRSRES